VARGWARRTAGRDDARMRVVALTPDGAAAAGSMAEARRARIARLLDRIPDGERPAVLSAPAILTEAAREP